MRRIATTPPHANRRSGRWPVPGLLPWVLLAFVSPAAGADDDAETADSAAVRVLTRPSSTVELGAAAASGRNPYPRGSHGMPGKGLSAIGGFYLQGDQYSYRNPDDDLIRWRLVGRDLGLQAPSLHGEYGRQGRYRLTFDYSQLRFLTSDSYRTPLLGTGTASLPLPAGFVRGATTGAMPNLSASMAGFELQTVRERTGIAWSQWLTDGWQATVSVHNDALDGTRARGAEFGSFGGNARAMLLPEPIDSSTQHIGASLAFADEEQRWVLAYHGSMFRNHVDAVTWQNPYTNAAWVGGATGLAAGFPLDYGRFGVAPDNDHHQLSVNGSYDLNRTTHLSLRLSRGRMTQNARFLPYSVNPGLALAALPRSSLEGRVETRFLSARLSMRPVRQMSLVASLRYDARDNHTPQAEYRYVGGDAALQPEAGADSDHIRTNLARSRRLVRWGLDADYRLPESRVVHLGWAREAVRRSFTEVESNAENSYRVELRQNGVGAWNASAMYEWARRRGGPYLYNLPYLASYTSAAHVDGLLSANGCTDAGACVRAGPLQRKFYLADRDRTRMRVVLGYMPAGAFSLQTRAEWQRDGYPDADYGVRAASGWSFGADAGYAWESDLRATVFFVREQQRTRERGRQVTAGPAVAGPGSDWTNELRDMTSSYGVGMHNLRLSDGRLVLDMDLVAVRGRSPIRTAVGPNVAAAQNPAGDFPDLRYRSDNLSVVARYHVDANSHWKLRYLYSKVDQDDWAFQQVGIATLPNVVGTGETVGRRSVHAIGVSFVRTFR